MTAVEAAAVITMAATTAVEVAAATTVAAAVEARS